MKNLRNLFLILLLTIYACSSSSSENEKELPPEGSKTLETPLTKSASQIPVALFTEIKQIERGAESAIITQKLIDYINAVPEDASIYISIYFFEYTPIIQSLKKAYDRNVKLNIMMDMSDRSNNQETLSEMQGWGDDIQLVQIKNDASSIAINHNKFVLFSEVSSEDKKIKNIVFQTSHNFHHTALKKLQDAVILSNSELYNAYLDYWNQMAKLSTSGMKNYTYSEFRSNNGKLSAYFYPKRKNGERFGEDTFIEILDNITNPKETVIKIGMSDWTDSRINIMNKLYDLQLEGATIEIITKNSSKGPKLMAGLEKLQEAGAYVKVFNLKSAIDIPKINIHMKLMMIDGSYKNKNHKMIITGTQNFTNNAIWNSNETTLILTDHELFSDYQTYFSKIKKLPGLGAFSN